MRVLWRTPRRKRASSGSCSGSARGGWARSFIGLRLPISFEPTTEENSDIA